MYFASQRKTKQHTSFAISDAPTPNTQSSAKQLSEQSSPSMQMQNLKQTPFSSKLQRKSQMVLPQINIGNPQKFEDKQLFTPKVTTQSKLLSIQTPKPIQKLPQLKRTSQSEQQIEPISPVVRKIQIRPLQKLQSHPQLSSISKSKIRKHQSLAFIQAFDQDKKYEVRPLVKRTILNCQPQRNTVILNPILESIAKEFEEKPIISEEDELKSEQSIGSPKASLVFSKQVSIVTDDEIIQNENIEEQNSSRARSQAGSIDSPQNKQRKDPPKKLSNDSQGQQQRESQEKIIGSKNGSMKNNSQAKYSDPRSSEMRSKNESVSSMTQKSEDYYSIWDNKDLVYRGVDFDEIDKKDNLQQFLQFFKMRFGQFPGQKEEIKNEEVISVAVNFARVNKKMYRKYFPTKQVIFEDDMDYSKPHEVEKDPNFIKFMDYIKDLEKNPSEELEEYQEAVQYASPQNLRRRVLRQKTQANSKPSLFKIESSNEL